METDNSNISNDTLHFGEKIIEWVENLHDSIPYLTFYLDSPDHLGAKFLYVLKNYTPLKSVKYNFHDCALELNATKSTELYKWLMGLENKEQKYFLIDHFFRVFMVGYSTSYKEHLKSPDITIKKDKVHNPREKERMVRMDLTDFTEAVVEWVEKRDILYADPEDYYLDFSIEKNHLDGERLVVKSNLPGKHCSIYVRVENLAPLYYQLKLLENKGVRKYIQNELLRVLMGYECGYTMNCYAG